MCTRLSEIDVFWGYWKWAVNWRLKNTDAHSREALKRFDRRFKNPILNVPNISFNKRAPIRIVSRPEASSWRSKILTQIEFPLRQDVANRYFQRRQFQTGEKQLLWKYKCTENYVRKLKNITNCPNFEEI